MFQLANVLEIDLDLVKNAVSVFCRLGFARKKTPDFDLSTMDPSWHDYTPNCKKYVVPLKKNCMIVLCLVNFCIIIGLIHVNN